MESALNWGLGIIRAFQGIESPALTGIALAITSLGTEYFFLAALPILYWCWDERRALRLGLLCFVNLFVNISLKDWIALPRPYHAHPDVFIAEETNYSFPSWHAQGTASFWGLLAFWLKRPWGLVLGIGMPLLIGLTRIYLGVHYPTDVLAGWGIGMATALGFKLLETRGGALLGKLNVRFQVAIVAAISWLMCALHLSDVAPGAAFFGIGLGYAFNLARLRFSASGKPGQKILRVFLGGAVMALIFFGLKWISPRAGQANYALFRFLRYGLAAFWVSFGAPWCFLRLGLARPSVVESTDSPRNAAGESPGAAPPESGEGDGGAEA